MRRTIWKFPLAVTDFQTLSMPRGAEVLSVANRGGQLCLWAMVDPNAETDDRRFEVFGTGNPVSYDMGIDRKFIGTVLMSPFVWHVFEYTGV